MTPGDALGDALGEGGRRGRSLLARTVRLFDRGRRAIDRAFNRVLPKRLFARSLLIIVMPLVLLQCVVTLVFMERHWNRVTERLSDALVRDVAALTDVLVAGGGSPEAIALVERIAGERLEFNVALLPPGALPLPVRKPLIGLLDASLARSIAEEIGRPFWIDTVSDEDRITIILKLAGANLRVVAPRSRAYASNSHIFLVWMLAASVILAGVAVLFLRGQIRPIQMLADAAEMFGRGQPAPEQFRPRGATEVRRAGLAFVQMRERIERQIGQRTTMLTGVSHDLRTILTRLRLQLAIAGPDELDPELHAEFDRDLDDMEAMLRGYMEFARGEGEEDIGTLSLADLVERARAEAASRGRDLALRMSGEDAASVRPVAFTRLVMNLVSNACRHASCVRLTVHHVEGRLLVVVEDDGPGIPPEHVEDAFRPFVRLGEGGEEDRARNQDHGGTGLGLTIARDIARSHGGDLLLDRSPDLGGLRATVSVPA